MRGFQNPNADPSEDKEWKTPTSAATLVKTCHCLRLGQVVAALLCRFGVNQRFNATDRVLVSQATFFVERWQWYLPLSGATFAPVSSLETRSMWGSFCAGRHQGKAQGVLIWCCCAWGLNWCGSTGATCIVFRRGLGFDLADCSFVWASFREISIDFLDNLKLLVSK